MTIAGLGVAWTGVLWATTDSWQAARRAEAGLDDWLTLVAGGALLAVLAWTTLILLVVAAAALPGVAGATACRLARILGPAAARRCAGLALGLTVAAGPMAVPAGAATAPSGAASVPVAAVADGGVLPAMGRPATTARAAPQPMAAHGRHHDARSAVRVGPGDSLWAIAARALGPDATDAAIAAEWPRWYAANRDVVGPDPDLILPGAVLRPPAR